MSQLPVCSGWAAIRAFQKAGWIRDRQKGSHVTMVRPGSSVVLTTPLHGQLGPGLVRILIRSSGLTVDEFKAHL